MFASFFSEIVDTESVQTHMRSQHYCVFWKAPHTYADGTYPAIVWKPLAAVFAVAWTMLWVWVGNRLNLFTPLAPLVPQPHPALVVLDVVAITAMLGWTFGLLAVGLTQLLLVAREVNVRNREASAYMGFDFPKCVADIAAGNVPLWQVDVVYSTTACLDDADWRRLMLVWDLNEWKFYTTKCRQVAWMLIRTGHVAQFGEAEWEAGDERWLKNGEFKAVPAPVLKEEEQVA